MSFHIGWRSRAKNLEYRRRERVTAGRTAGVTGPGAGATRRERDIRAGAEDAEYRNWKRRQEGWQAPPGNVSKNDVHY